VRVRIRARVRARDRLKGRAANPNPNPNLLQGLDLLLLPAAARLLRLVTLELLVLLRLVPLRGDLQPSDLLLEQLPPLHLALLGVERGPLGRRQLLGLGSGSGLG